MIYPITPIEDAAARMVNAALPLHGTPPRAERIENFERAQADLARLSVEAVFEIDNNHPPAYSAFVPLGIYATREALSSLTRQDKVDPAVSASVSGELQEISSYLRKKTSLLADKGLTLGFAAELGMVNMIWAGIAEGELDVSYAALLGVSGLETESVGLKKDVDLIVRANGSGKARKRVQLKTSRKRAGNIYDDSVTVLTAQDIVSTSTPVEAVAKLLNWSTVSEEIRLRTYRNLEVRLGILPPRWTPETALTGTK